MSTVAGCENCYRSDDARALWAVRVLDAWAAQVNGRVWMVSQHEGPLPTWCCKLGGLRWFNQDTADGARFAAAEFVLPELPEDARAKLGERP